MTIEPPEQVKAILEIDEEVIWSGKFEPKRVHKILLVVAVLLSAACIWLGWANGSPFSIWAPNFAIIVFSILALIFGAFSSLLILNQLNSGETYLTNLRILSTKKGGTVSPRSGFPYDFSDACRITSRGTICDLDIPTIKIESGYPDFYSLGGLEAEVADALTKLFEDLKDRANTIRTDA